MDKELKTDAVVEVEKPVKKKAPAETTDSAVDIEMPMWKYFEEYRPDVHKYTRAYIEVSYRGIMMTRTKWEAELKGKL